MRPGARSIAAFALCLVCSAPARAAELWMNPGTMGPNALPTVMGESARISDATSLRVEATGQYTRHGDLSFAPFFRLEVPFGRWVSLLGEGRPVETWRVSQRTVEDWGLSRRSGIVGGDLLFGAKFQFLKLDAPWPSVAVRALTKTTTGKAYYDRRHTNAPGYFFDLIVAQPITSFDDWSLEAWGDVGFFAWQQGRNNQNDAPTYAATLALRHAEGSSVRAEVRGYWGWQTDDKPLVAAVAAEWAVHERVWLSASAHAGLFDAPLVDVRLGFVLRLPTVFPLGGAAR